MCDIIYHANKKKETKTENTILKHWKYIREDSNNRKNETHKVTHNRKKWNNIEVGESSKWHKVAQQIKPNVRQSRKILRIKPKV